MTRLIALHRWPGETAAYQRTKFAQCYTARDVELLAHVDKAHGNLSGPATRRILQREYLEYGQAAYQRLSTISVAHLYRLRNSQAYRKRNTTYQPTRPTPIPIGESGAHHNRTAHRGAQDHHRSQQQAPPRLLMLGHSLRVAKGVAALPKVPAAWRHFSRNPEVERYVANKL